MTAEQLARTILRAPGVPDPGGRRTVRDFLIAATAAHLGYRRAVTDGITDPETLRVFLLEAAAARARAEALDGRHADPAWQGNGGTHPDGRSSHADLHVDLLQFYVHQLGLDEEAR